MHDLLGRQNKYLTKSISRKVRKGILRKARKELASGGFQAVNALSVFFCPLTYQDHAKNAQNLCVLCVKKRGAALAAWRGEACEAPSEAKPGKAATPLGVTPKG